MNASCLQQLYCRVTPACIESMECICPSACFIHQKDRVARCRPSAVRILLINNEISSSVSLFGVLKFNTVSASRSDVLHGKRGSPRSTTFKTVVLL
jgi:hypothetical protein